MLASLDSTDELCGYFGTPQRVCLFHRQFNIFIPVILRPGVIALTDRMNAERSAPSAASQTVYLKGSQCT